MVFSAYISYDKMSRCRCPVTNIFLHVFTSPLPRLNDISRQSSLSNKNLSNVLALAGSRNRGHELLHAKVLSRLTFCAGPRVFNVDPVKTLWRRVCAFGEMFPKPYRLPHNNNLQVYDVYNAYTYI